VSARRASAGAAPRRPAARPRRARRGAGGRARWVRRLRLAGLGVAALVALPQVGDYLMSLRTVEGCRVTQVIDGDTVRLACPDGEAGRVRLIGFDTPEIFSPQCAREALAGALATQKLRSIVWGADEIGVIFRGHDRYGRRLAEMSVDGESVAALMTTTGHARPYGGRARASWCG